MVKNSKESFAEVHKNGNMKNRIEVQVYKIQIIKIEEAAKKGRDCESSRPLSDVLVINDNCLWTNGS